MAKIPASIKLEDIQASFRDINTRLDQFLEQELDFHGHRVINAGSAVGPNDYVTLSQARTLISEALPVTEPVSTIITPEDVVWRDIVGATAVGNTLTATGAPGWGNSGAASTRAIEIGDGYTEHTLAEVTYPHMCGLSNGNTDANFTDIDFAAYALANAFYVFEFGVLVFGPGATTLAIGDVLRVAVNSGVVRYYINGALQYTSAASPTYPLLVDAASAQAGAVISNAKICGVLATRW